MNKTFMNWSGGKDSCLALHHSLQNPNLNVDLLFTSLSEQHQRITMHGVRKSLLEAQVKSIGIPLEKLYLSEGIDMEKYDDLMHEKLRLLIQKGYTHSIFGDIFLEDLKKYREEKLDSIGLKGVFPLWQKDSLGLVHEFLDLGYTTHIVCLNAKLLPKEFCGEKLTRELLKELPKDVNPAGENGEFHTFVSDGPIFKKPLELLKSETTLHKYPSDKDAKWDAEFWYTDFELK